MLKKSVNCIANQWITCILTLGTTVVGYALSYNDTPVGQLEPKDSVTKLYIRKSKSGGMTNRYYVETSHSFIYKDIEYMYSSGTGVNSNPNIFSLFQEWTSLVRQAVEIQVKLN